MADYNDPFGDGSLLARYNFDGDGGDSIGNNNATEVNVNYVSGITNRAAEFTTGSLFNLGTALLEPTSHTVRLIVKHYSLAQSTCLYSQYIPSVSGRTIVNSNDDGSIQLNNGGSNSRSHGISDLRYKPIFLVGVWQELVVVKDGAQGWRVYIDKIFVGTWDNTDNTITSANTEIGGDTEWGVDRSLDGCIDFCEIYNKGLTEEEVQALPEPASVYQKSTDFLPMDAVPDDIAYYPESAALSTTVGTGLLNESGAPVYFDAGKAINRGQTRTFITDDLSIVSELVFAEDGTVTLTESLGVTIGHIESESIGFRYLNGQLAIADSDGNVAVYSKGFNYGLGTITAIELADGETIDVLIYSFFSAGVVDFTNYYLSQIKPTWANKETREQANPQPEQVQTLTQTLDTKLLGKSGNYNSLLNQQGELRKTGYYQSTVTVSDIPKPNTRVLCMTNDGQLLDETYSNESGVYRFDHLLMEDKYLFIAQYNNGNPKVAPEYLAAAADWQSPTPYGS